MYVTISPFICVTPSVLSICQSFFSSVFICLFVLCLNNQTPVVYLCVNCPSVRLFVFFSPSLSACSVPSFHYRYHHTAILVCCFDPTYMYVVCSISLVRIVAAGWILPHYPIKRSVDHRLIIQYMPDILIPSIKYSPLSPTARRSARGNPPYRVHFPV